MRENFQVDLGGVVDILSRHLYSSEKVYVRELIQNAVDAITARQAADPSAPPGRITITTDVETASVTVHDDGIGLTPAEMRSLLATIGASSKRATLDDDWAAARQSFLGQFGIGLLSTFLVADQVEVRSRSARQPDAPTATWTGFADGNFQVDDAPEPLPAPGTVVTVRARPDQRRWVHPRVVGDAAADYAAHLEVPVHVAQDGHEHVVGGRTPPWRLPAAEASRRAEDLFGFTPLAVVPLSAPAAGVEGVAFVLPHEARPGGRVGDAVYLRGMLLSAANDQLLPESAFFVRAVLDAGDLRPTASREHLQDDDLLAQVRRLLGDQVLDWVRGLEGTDPAAFAAFVRVHEVGLKAMATTRPDLAELVCRTVTFRTNGDRFRPERPARATLAELAAEGSIRHVGSPDAFRSVAELAAGLGLRLVDASYVYDADVLAVAGDVLGVPVEEVDLGWLVDEMAPPASDRRDQAGAVERLVTDVLGHGTVLARSFAPTAVAAVHVAGSPHRSAEVGDASGVDADLWDAMLGSATDGDDVVDDLLVVNLDNRLVQRLVDPDHPLPAGVVYAAVTALAVVARLRAGATVEGDQSRLAGALERLLDLHDGSL